MHTSMVRMFMVMGLLAGLVGLYGSACANSEEDGARNGEGVKPECDPVEDDGNPCTAERCKGSQQEHEPISDKDCGTGLTCKNGQCIGCKAPEDCGVSDECKTQSCNEGICTPTFTAKGTALMMQMQRMYDCTVVQCNGIGEEEPVQDPEDKPPYAMDCIQPVCNNGVLESGSALAGTPCTSSDPKDKVCDDAGGCVECNKDSDCNGTDAHCYNKSCFSCSDNTQNGNETQKDCGGSCKKCNGDPCGDLNECASNFCIDGICCVDACMVDCRACNVPNALGKCANLPVGSTDPGTCDAPKACSSLGICEDKAPNGTDCGSNGACVTNFCNNGKCQSCQPSDNCGGSRTCTNGVCI